MMKAKPDLTYREDSPFVRFFAETPAGETAWNELAAHSEGSGAFLLSHKDAVISQLRAAGYSVAKAAPFKPMKAGELDALLAEIEGLSS